MEKEKTRRIIWVSVFAIAMAFVETTVVYYLRKLYYPDNVLFPLNTSMPGTVLAIEWVRETCTIIMLLGIAVLAGKKFQEKLAYFIYSFAIWDIFYYVWLKVLLDWPSSFLTWDILFLIPITWVSPVLAPILVSCTMIILALVIIKYPEEKIKVFEWILLATAVVLSYVSFVWNYSSLILKKGFLVRFSQISVSPEFMQALSQYIPKSYPWIFLVFAEIFATIAIVSFYRRTKNKKLRGK